MPIRRAASLVLAFACIAAFVPPAAARDCVAENNGRVIEIESTILTVHSERDGYTWYGVAAKLCGLDLVIDAPQPVPGCVEGARMRIRGEVREEVSHSNGYPVMQWVFVSIDLSCSPGT